MLGKFGEAEERWELYDWDRKMEEYRKEIEDEENARQRKIEKSKKLEKGWELMKICKKFIEENSKAWKDEDEMRKKKKDAEEKKTERLRTVAIKKGRLKENEVQRKILEALAEVPQMERNEYHKNEEDNRRKELRNVKENLWKKWRCSRDKERKKDTEEVE